MMAMTATALFVAVVLVTVWGWRAIPPQGRFPVSFGVPPSVEGTMPKRWGLSLFFLVGLWCFTLTLLAASEDEQIGWVGVGLLAFFVSMEYRLVRHLTD